MAAQMTEDRKKRTVIVKRSSLIETLTANRAKHIAEHATAIAGYKQERREKLEKAFDDAEKKLRTRRQHMLEATDAMVDEDIVAGKDYVQIISAIGLDLSVPRSYEKEYDAAIDMATWDTRDELELTHAEFSCFVRDCWDWTDEFSLRNSVYIAKAAR